MAGLQTQDAHASGSTQVAVRSGRRRFTAEYKASVVQEAAGCRAPGEIGALLRREGLYSSHLTMWRQQAAVGARRALAQRRGPTAKQTPEASAVARLERENAQLRDELARAELVIALQKKLAALLDRSPALSGAPT
jgi:transposase-like protein